MKFIHCVTLGCNYENPGIIKILNMQKRKDKSAFYEAVHNEYLLLHKSGDATPLRNHFRKSEDSYEQNYIYSLLTNEHYGICKYIKTKDVFKVNHSVLDPNIVQNKDLLSKLFNHYKETPKDLDLSFGGKFGYIYILDNKSLPNLVKIGYTAGTAFERAKQLSNTSVPNPFEVRYLARVRHPRKVEQNVHQLLTKYRLTTNREFFQISIDDAVVVIEECASYLKHQDSSKKF